MVAEDRIQRCGPTWSYTATSHLKPAMAGLNRMPHYTSRKSSHQSKK